MALEPREFLTKMEGRMLFNDEDKVILKANADWGKQIAPKMTEHFYEFLNRDEEMASILNQKDGRMDRLRATFTEWFSEMFSGMDNWGDAYAVRRWRIGLVHVKLGIAPQHVVPAMATVVREVNNQIKAEGKDAATSNALQKICMIDLAFIEQAYVEVSSSAVRQETGWSEALFKRMIATGSNSM